MIIVLHGVDTFRSREKLRQLVARYQEKYPAGLGLFRFSGDEARPSDIEDALRGGSLFQTKRLVVIERPDAADAAGQERLIALAQSKDVAESTDTVAVLWFGGVLKRDSGFGKLAADKRVRAEGFDPLEGAALRRWTAKYVAGFGVKIEADAAARLAAVAGSDTWRLAMELQKLASFVGSRATISKRDVDALVARPASPQTFAFADAIASRDRAAALALLHEHLSAGDSPQALLGMIGYALRTLSLVGSGAPTQPAVTLAKTLALHPFVVHKTLRLVAGFPPQEVGRATQLLADADWYMKTGRLDPALALERFVMAVTKSESVVR